MMYSNDWMGWAGFGGGLIGMLFFWGLIIFGIATLARYWAGGAKQAQKGQSPIDVVKMRYAKGEINKEEYEDTLKALA